MDKKLIFLDIDGTLTLPGSNEPPESALKAIEMARENGHLIFLCTGRNLAMISPLLKYDFDGVVASAGGYVTCQGKVLYDNAMSPEQLSLAMEVFKKNQVFRTIECLDASYTDSGLKAFLENQEGPMNSELLRWRKQLESSLNMIPMEQYQNEPVYKLVFMCMDEKQLAEPKEVLSDIFNVCVQDADKYGCINGEIIKKEFSKATGIHTICDSLGMTIEDTIGFGDSMNDLEMIETVGMSICMENGSETLKKKAKRICPSVQEDGIYKEFLNLGLISEV